MVSGFVFLTNLSRTGIFPSVVLIPCRAPAAPRSLVAAAKRFYPLQSLGKCQYLIMEGKDEPDTVVSVRLNVDFYIFRKLSAYTSGPKPCLMPAAPDLDSYTLQLTQTLQGDMESLSGQ